LDLIKNHKAFGSIYVCTDALFNFYENFLDNIKEPFVLVTGDSDSSININHNNYYLYKILNHHYLINWFAQNLVSDHPKLKHIPIGMDYHTMWENPGMWGLFQQTPISQERALIDCFAKAPIFENRIFASYCNWHFEISRGDREDCFNKINDKGICFFENNRIPRLSTWQRQSSFMFVISPEGAGIDCHRTWEALLLGCVPILKKSNFTNILNGLPVVILNDWNELNKERLLSEYQRIANSNFDYSKIFLKYWINNLNSKKNNITTFENLSMKDFKNLICNISI
jgi:hypothetical protein